MAHPQTPDSGNENPEYYAEDSRNPMTERDFLLLLQTPDASTQNTKDDCNFLEQFRWKENNSAHTSETSEENRKRKISNEEDITHDTDAQKRSIPEVCETNHQVTFDFSENRYINPDSQTNEITMSSQIALNSGSLASVNSEFSYSEKSHSKNKELKAFHYSGKEENSSTEQYTASNKNIFQKENEEYKIINTDISKAANIYSVDNRLAVPGPSHSLENNSCKKLYINKVQNVSPLKQPPVETEQIQLECLSCNGTVSKHVEVHDGKDMYKCCRCAFRHENFNYLQIHVYNVHSRPHYCNVCQMNYSDVGAHAPDQTCDVCYQNFECKYQLEEHYYSYHEDFNETHCRICKKEFDKHFSKEVKKYQCCFRECKFQDNKSYLISHLYSHFLLKVYKCEVCGNHSKHSSDVKKHLQKHHPLCELCGKRFLNIHFMYKHHCEEHDDK